MRKRLCVVLVGAWLGACAYPLLPKEEVTPPDLEIFRVARSSATTCANPAQPRVEERERFTYGCFCGANYPDFASHDLSTLSKEELLAIVSRYYTVLPWDDLDAQCQAHDICYVYHREARRSCDEAFQSAVLQLAKGFLWESRIRRQKAELRHAVNPLAARCSDLAYLLLTAEMFFKGKSNDPSYELKAEIVNYTMIGPILGFAVIGLPLNSFPDPLASEKCRTIDNTASPMFPPAPYW